MHRFKLSKFEKIEVSISKLINYITFDWSQWIVFHAIPQYIYIGLAINEYSIQKLQTLCIKGYVDELMNDEILVILSYLLIVFAMKFWYRLR